MAQSEKVKAFKNELRNYKYYLFKISSLKNAIEYSYHRLGGVRAIDPSKEPIHCAVDKECEWRIREDISNYDAKLSLYKAKVEEIERILGFIEETTRDVIEDLYFNGMTYDKVAEKYHFSKSTISDRIDRELEKVLD